jgi:hypothetical protein
VLLPTWRHIHEVKHMNMAVPAAVLRSYQGSSTKLGSSARGVG